MLKTRALVTAATLESRLLTAMGSLLPCSPKSKLFRDNLRFLGFDSPAARPAAIGIITPFRMMRSPLSRAAVVVVLFVLVLATMYAFVASRASPSVDSQEETATRRTVTARGRIEPES